MPTAAVFTRHSSQRHMFESLTLRSKILALPVVATLGFVATLATTTVLGRRAKAELVHIERESSPCVEFATLRVVLTWTCLSAVRHLLPSFEAVADSEDFGEQVTLGLRVPREHLDRLRAALGNATSGQAIFPDDARPSA